MYFSLILYSNPSSVTADSYPPPRVTSLSILRLISLFLSFCSCSLSLTSSNSVLLLSSFFSSSLALYFSSLACIYRNLRSCCMCSICILICRTSSLFSVLMSSANIASSRSFLMITCNSAIFRSFKVRLLLFSFSYSTSWLSSFDRSWTKLANLDSNLFSCLATTFCKVTSISTTALVN